MVLNVGRIGDNASVPFAGAETYIPDQLIAGNAKLVTQAVNITGGVNLSRGSVLGLVRDGSAGLVGSPVAVSGNHGNGVISAIAFFQQAKVGLYLVNFTGATTFRVIDPNGVELVQSGANEWGPDTDSPEISFTFTAGTAAMVNGDEIQIIAAPSATGSYKLARPEATDGSQDPCAILMDQALAGAGDVLGGIYLTGEFNGNALIYDSAWTIAQLTALLRKWNIHVKTQVNATDPVTNTGGAMGGDAGGNLV
jgi:Bacteriophage lambda head decoration protein D